MAMRKYSPNRCSQRSLPRVASEMALGTFCQRGPEPLAAQPVSWREDAKRPLARTSCLDELRRMFTAAGWPAGPENKRPGKNVEVDLAASAETAISLACLGCGPTASTVVVGKIAACPRFRPRRNQAGLSLCFLFRDLSTVRKKTQQTPQARFFSLFGDRGHAGDRRCQPGHGLSNARFGRLLH